MALSKTIKRTDAIALRKAYQSYVEHLAKEIYCLSKPDDNKNPSKLSLQESGNACRRHLANVLTALNLV